MPMIADFGITGPLPPARAPAGVPAGPGGCRAATAKCSACTIRVPWFLPAMRVSSASSCGGPMAFGCRTARGAGNIFGPRQGIAPAVECAATEHAVGRSATSRCFCRQCLRRHRIARIGKGGGHAFTREKSIRVVGYVSHSGLHRLRAKARDCDGA
jgi:hypothetical protein